MTLRALKFVAGPDGVASVRTELSDELIRSFGSQRTQAQPAAYVVLSDELPRLNKFEGLVVDRGRKHEAKPLAKLLLGHARIPFVNGSYESPGQLLRSVRTLLQNASDKEDRNIYVIGTSARIFDELWERAGSPSGSGRAASRPTTGRPGPKAAPGSALSSHLLEILPQREIPEEFNRTFLGGSAEAQLVRQLVMRAASSDDPVLILGDTGTGKEVVARSIHRYGFRASEKFVAVNCAAIPTELFESELFGHKRGSFTDARSDKKGLWESTGKGTLFLDEVGDLAPVHQAKILRALDENKIRRVGEENEITVSARVIAATNRDLFAMVRAGRFRDDLYYRLRAFLIRTPALRTHPEDIPQLARRFWQKIAADEQAVLPADIMDELRSYGWPGNARELKAVLSSLHALFGNDNLDVARLRAVFQIQRQSPPEIEEAGLENELILHRAECLRQLKRVDEVLSACVVSVKPLSGAGQPDLPTAARVSAALGTRLTELEGLCMKPPLLFHSQMTFELVHGLKDKLWYFYRLLGGDAMVAASYWKNEVRRELNLTQSAIFQETARLEAIA